METHPSEARGQRQYLFRLSQTHDSTAHFPNAGVASIRPNTPTQLPFKPLAIPASRCASRNPCKAARYSACIPASQPSDHLLASASLGSSDIASLLIGRPALPCISDLRLGPWQLGKRVEPFLSAFILRFYGVQPACRHSRCPTTGYLHCSVVVYLLS